MSVLEVHLMIESRAGKVVSKGPDDGELRFRWSTKAAMGDMHTHGRGCVPVTLYL